MTVYLLSLTTYIHVALNLGIYQQVWWGMYEIELMSVMDFGVQLLVWFFYNACNWRTSYRLDSLGFKPQWGARFFIPIQTSPEAHPALHSGYCVSFPGIKWPECSIEWGALHLWSIDILGLCLLDKG